MVQWKMFGDIRYVEVESWRRGELEKLRNGEMERLIYRKV